MRIPRITAARGKSQFLIPPSIQVWGIPEPTPLGTPSRHAARRDQDGFNEVDIDFEDICDCP